MYLHSFKVSPPRYILITKEKTVNIQRKGPADTVFTQNEKFCFCITGHELEVSPYWKDMFRTA